MEEERGQFTFYASFAKAIRRIKKAADRAAAYDAICAYALNGELPDIDELPDAAAVAFEVAKPILDSSRRKAENGKKGGAKAEKPEASANAKQEQTGSKPMQSASKPEASANAKQEKEQEQVKEQVKEKDKEQMLYTPSYSPTTPEKSKGKDEDDGFSAFWAAYPRKTGNIDQAYFEYRGALQSGVRPETLLEAITWQAKEWSETQEARYMPSAEKWLHNRGWEAKKGIGKAPAPKTVTAACKGPYHDGEELNKIINALGEI